MDDDYEYWTTQELTDFLKLKKVQIPEGATRGDLVALVVKATTPVAAAGTGTATVSGGSTATGGSRGYAFSSWYREPSPPPPEVLFLMCWDEYARVSSLLAGLRFYDTRRGVGS